MEGSVVTSFSQNDAEGVGSFDDCLSPKVAALVTSYPIPVTPEEKSIAVEFILPFLLGPNGEAVTAFIKKRWNL